jgi:hypothetical protein
VAATCSACTETAAQLARMAASWSGVIERA